MDSKKLCFGGAVQPSSELAFSTVCMYKLVSIVSMPTVRWLRKDCGIDLGAEWGAGFSPAIDNCALCGFSVVMSIVGR